SKCLFFYQAEDSIRRFHVTGVQTCALPISRLSFGINNNVSWKNFTLNAFFQGIWKRDHWPTSGNWTWFFPFNAGHVEKYFIEDRSEERRVGKERRPMWSPHKGQSLKRVRLI